MFSVYGNDGRGGTSGPPPASSAAAPSAAASSPTTAATDLLVATTKLGRVIVDAKGMTVYYFTPDVANSGKSVCSGQCLTAWPAVVPAAAKASATGVSGDVGVITRSDGTKQVTVDGRPVYTFIGDKAPGDVKGQDVKKVWFVISPSGAQIGGTTSKPSTTSSTPAADLKIATTKLGPVIVDAKGMTVYYFKPDVPNSGKSSCSGECLAAWPAVVPAGATPVANGVTGKVGEITRSDGTKQLTVDGRPVYLFVGDKKAGATNGQDVKKVWFAVAPNGDQINS